MKKIKVILDTDPGVDDATGLIFALTNPHFDVKLISTCYGNVSLATATRNACHILDILNLDVPVVRGSNKRLSGSTEDATFLHMKEGMGGYIPPKTTKHKPMDADCIEVIYEMLKAEPKQIVFCNLGPHTTFANLLIRHPDAKDLVGGVIMEGGAPEGIKADPNHCSFNVRTDIVAFKKTLDSGLPVTMVPSTIGRDWAFFTEEQVDQLQKMNDIGRLIAKTYETYWEPFYSDKRIAANDISALVCLAYPKLFKLRRANLDLDEKTGRIHANYTRKGQFKIAVAVKREKMHKVIFDTFKKLDVKIENIDKKDTRKKPNWDENDDFNEAEGLAKKNAKTAAKQGNRTKAATATKSTSAKSTQPKKTKSTGSTSTKTTSAKSASTKTSSAKKSTKKSN